MIAHTSVGSLTSFSFSCGAWFSASNFAIFSFSPSISANGRYVAFESPASDLIGNDKNGSTADIFVYDRKTKKTKLISRSTDANGANGSSINPSISADGRFVAFSSTASDLIGNDGNSTQDAFVFDHKNSHS